MFFVKEKNKITFDTNEIFICIIFYLETLTPNNMLGRVLGLEYSIARCSEASIAFVAGGLEDRGYTKSQIASLSSVLGIILLTLWSLFHITGRGAANKKLFPSEKKDIEMPLCLSNSSL